MTKLILILFIALLLEAVGVVYVSMGIKQVGQHTENLPTLSLKKIGRLLGEVLTNGTLWVGIALEAAFFVLLLILLNGWDVSLIWPLTSLGFVLTTVAARYIRHEEVSAVRWMGVFLIMGGAALVAYSEKLKPSAPPAQTADSTPGRK